MKFFNKQTGFIGENLAAKELEKKDYEILERNFSNKFGEIDIIAKDKNTLVFVEVKTKTGVDFGLPEEMINPRKLFKIRNMAAIYMKGQNFPCRIDVVAIVLNENNEVTRLTHHENVYL